MNYFTCNIIILALAVSLQANWQKATDTLSAADGSSGDHFGYSIDIGEQFAVVGAPDVYPEGAAYVFKKEDNGTWTQMQKLDDSTPRSRGFTMTYIEEVDVPDLHVDCDDCIDDATGDLCMLYFQGRGASVAIAESLDEANTNPHLIVVGAPDSHAGCTSGDYDTGAICTYEYNTSTARWEEQDYCLFGRSIQGDAHRFGHSVDISNWVTGYGIYALSSARIIVGDPDINDIYADAGSITFLDYNASGHTWNKVAVVSDPSTYGVNDINFGYSVAIDKTTAIIGAPGTVTEGPISQVGKVYFYYANGVFISEFAPTHIDPAGGHRFGISVDIDGTYAIVGEEHYLDADDFGAAYILKKPDTTWLVDTLLEGSAHSYGTSVAVNSSHAAVGAPTRYYLDKYTGTPVYTGAVYIYDNNGSDVWSESLYNVGSSMSFFGQSVSLYGESLMVGAHGDELVQPYQFKSGLLFNPALIMYLLN